MTFTCKAILFDLDGVLVDSTQAVERVWRKWAIEHKLDPQLVLDHAHGRRSVETIRIVAPELDAEEENLNVEQMEVADTEGIVAIKGADQLLGSLPAPHFAFVTSATRALAVARLHHAGLAIPSNLITADDVQEGKPSPEPYLKGAALLGIPATDCLVFEDTPAGIESGKTAGMRVIALNTTYPAKELQAADAVLSSLAGVKAKLNSGVMQITLPVE